MFAISFDMTTASLNKNHPGGASQAYTEIKRMMADHGFQWAQGSVYLSTSEDFTSLFTAINNLQGKHWFRASVRDIRAFRAE